MTGTLGTDNLRARAEGHAARGEWPEAIAIYERLLASAPESVDILLQLSYTHSLAGHYNHAREHALRAFAAAEGGRLSEDAAVELVSRLRTFNLVPELRACVDSMKPVARMPIPVLLRCAAQLSYVNLPESALELLDEARRADPDYPVTLLARAQVLMYCGRFDEAGKDLDRAIARAPVIPQGYWLRSALPREAGTGAARVDAIRRELARAGRRPPEVALLGYALHAELDALGDYPGAWQALELACRAKRSTIDYRPADARQLLDALRGMPALAPASQVPGEPPMPIFIVGMHRSGTTLLEQMLDGSPDVKGIGELYDFTSAMRRATDHHCKGVIDREIVRRAPAADLGEAGRCYLDGVAWRLDGAHAFTDKLPSNFLNLGFIAAALPHAKLLHMVRDPVETCFSNLRELFSEANPYSYTQGELADYFNGYRALMAHWRARLPGRILDVEYARLVREPEAVLREVCGFCGIAFDPAMLRIEERKRGVVTASAVQARSGITVRERPKWAPYERWLQPLTTGLSG